MLELNDRNLLTLLDQYGGKGVELEGVTYARGVGETPFAFINRVREEELERRYRKEAEKASQRRASSESTRAASNGPSETRARVSNAAQGSEESLEAALQSKVTFLTSKVAQYVELARDKQRELDDIRGRLQGYEFERVRATRFLEELRASTPENNKKMGEDMVGEVPEGPERSYSVGKQNST